MGSIRRDDQEEESRRLAFDLLSGKVRAVNKPGGLPGGGRLSFGATFACTTGGFGPQPEHEGWVFQETGSLGKRMTEIQVLAMSILRDGEEPATVAALLDEALAVYAQADEPVTEPWCVENGWERHSATFSSVWMSERRGDMRVVIGVDVGKLAVQHGMGRQTEVDYKPTVRKVVALCHALSIPWTNKRS